MTHADLIARLKTKSVWGKFGWEPDDDARKAADAIEALTAERTDWARRFLLNGVTPWEWMTRAERAEAKAIRLEEQLRLANVDAANMAAAYNDLLDLTPVGPGRTVDDALTGSEFDTAIDGAMKGER